MSLSNGSAFSLPSKSSKHSLIQTEVSKTKPRFQGAQTPQGPVAILWDIENCPVPSDVRPEDVGGNIRKALRVHPVIDGAVTVFSAYGDFNAFPRRLREGCQRTGVKLVDVPNGRKDAADKAILVDMFLFALDNPPPSSIMLISGDVDFAPALHILGQRGYTVILVIPSGVGVSSALSNAGHFVWDWPSVSRGGGFVPPRKQLYVPPRVCPTIRVSEQIRNVDIQDEEESIVYRGISRNCCNIRNSEQNNVNSRLYPPSGLNEGNVTAAAAETWVQPGDVDGLKGQLVKLLELLGGSLALLRLPAEYQKLYGRPLYVSEYGALKLVHLLKKMADAISIEGKGQKKFICLHNPKPLPIGGTPVILARRDKKEKGSSEEFSDDGEGGEKSILEMDERSSIIGRNLDKFKYDLQEILVIYSCRVFFDCFEAIYQQRYKTQLDYFSFGVNCLEALLEKVRDVVMLQEEPVSKRKYLVAVGG